MNLKILFLVFSLVTFALGQNLIMINLLFRHGARYPVYPKNDDMSNYTFTQHSLGQLTLAGKKMHYLLGQKLYETYWDRLFNEPQFRTLYNQSKFYIKSTDVNRTIESVQSQMMGIFQKLPPLNLPQNLVEYSLPQWPGVVSRSGNIFDNNGSSFHPVAIHVEKVGADSHNGGDFLRTYASENCPNQLVWQKQNQQRPRIKEIIQNTNFTVALQALSKALGKNVTFWQAPAYYDNYLCAKYMGRPFIQVFQHQDYRYSLDYIHTLQMYINLYSNPQQIRATATGFFNQTVLNIKKIISDKNSVRWNAYSAHDTTVGNMIAALNLTNVECIYDAFLKNATQNSDTCISQYPYYTANLIFQLYQNNGNHIIKLMYNGLPRKIPFCNWQFECPVQKLYDWYDGFKDQNFISTCGIIDPAQDQIETYFSVAAAEFFLLITVAIIFVISYLVKRNKISDSRQKPKNNSNSTISSYQANSPNGSNNMIKDSLLSEAERQNFIN